MQKRRVVGPRVRIICRDIHEHADASHALDLLRARRERPSRRRATNQRVNSRRRMDQSP